MRVYSDNGGLQPNHLLLPHHPNHREAQSQTHPIQSVHADHAGHISAEEFNGHFTSIDTEVVCRFCNLK